MFANISRTGSAKEQTADGDVCVPNGNWNDDRLNFNRSNVDNSWDNNGVRFSMRWIDTFIKNHLHMRWFFAKITDEFPSFVQQRIKDAG